MWRVAVILAADRAVVALGLDRGVAVALGPLVDGLRGPEGTLAVVLAPGVDPEAVPAVVLAVGVVRAATVALGRAVAVQHHVVPDPGLVRVPALDDPCPGRVPGPVLAVFRAVVALGRVVGAAGRVGAAVGRTAAVEVDPGPRHRPGQPRRGSNRIRRRTRE